jgi:dienelactone hydrolase
MSVVIYLRGCAGINRAHDASWAALLMEQGFIVVISDSLARLG